MTTLDHAGIAARIPHHGSMCLLDRVESWTPERIVCRATSHRDTRHPLREAGRLGASNGIEYAAQAMAVHGALLGGDGAPPRAGYLTSVRSVRLLKERLDDQAGELEIIAERQSGDANSVLYSFSVLANGELLLDGRATAVLDADAIMTINTADAGKPSAGKLLDC